MVQPLRMAAVGSGSQPSAKRSTEVVDDRPEASGGQLSAGLVIDGEPGWQSGFGPYLELFGDTIMA
jgi:hypothetical protein